MKFLQTILLVNAVSSGATGLLLVVLADVVAPLAGVPSPAVFTGVGLFLLIFAGLILFEIRRTPMRLERVRFIITLDRMWVLASLVLVLLPNIELNMIGRIAVVAVALWVALMAYLQSSNLRKITA